jgi:hypothetical protein
VVVCCREIVRLMFMVAEEAQKKPGEMCDVRSTVHLFYLTTHGYHRAFSLLQNDGQSLTYHSNSKSCIPHIKKDLQGDNVT